MSVCAIAMVAANSAVPTPTHAIRLVAQKAWTETSYTRPFTRVSRYTPEVTIVAA